MSVTPQTAEDRAAKWRKSGLRKWILALGLVVTIVDVGLIFLPFVPASWNFLRDCDSSSVVVGDPAARQPNKSTIEQHCSPELPSTGIVTLGLGLLGLLVLIELANTLPNFRVKALGTEVGWGDTPLIKAHDDASSDKTDYAIILAGKKPSEP